MTKEEILATLQESEYAEDAEGIVEVLFPTAEASSEPGDDDNDPPPPGNGGHL